MRAALLRLVVAVASVGVSVAYGEVPPLPTVAGLSSGGGMADPLVDARLRVLEAQQLNLQKHGRKGAFDLRFVSVGQVIDLLYDEGLKVPHVIASDVLQDDRVVSFEFDTSKGDLRSFVMSFLDSLGFQVVTRDGVDFVGKKGAGSVKADELEPFVYRPKHRTAAYLAKLVQPLFSRTAVASDSAAAGAAAGGGAGVASAVGASGVAVGTAAGAGAGVAGGMGGALGGVGGSQSAAVGADDELVVFGRHSDIANVRKVVEALDSAPGQVVVRGWVYEVALTDGENSAWSVAAHVLDGQLGIGAGSVAADANAFTFDAHFLKAAISALSSDTRFREVSDPHVRVVSGQKVSLNVGSQVPTVGSVSYQGSSGTPVQSVEYQNAGVLFSVQPTVMGDAVDVSIDEEISSFVPTTTGVNNSPTKNTRSMTTSVQMTDGEVVVLGGLVQDTASSSTDRQRWLPRFMDGKSSSKGRTEILLVLQVERV